MTGQYRHDGNLFCFFLPTRKKEEGNPTHIAHIAKAPHANAPTNALPKSAILPTHIVLFIKDTLFILKNEIIILF